MAYQTFTADGSKSFVLPRNNRTHTVTVDGSFGGGTATFYKKEGSTGTEIALKDSSGLPISATSAITFDADISGGDSTSSDEQTIIVVTLAGSSNPNLRATVNN